MLQISPAMAASFWPGRCLQSPTAQSGERDGDFLGPHGGFHNHGGTQKWMVCKGKTQLINRWFEGYHCFRTPPHVLRNFDAVSACFCTDFRSANLRTHDLKEPFDGDWTWLKLCHCKWTKMNIPVCMFQPSMYWNDHFGWSSRSFVWGHILTL